MEKRSFPSRASTADWSSLPWDALSLISTRLTSAVDYIRLRSVCSSWRSAAPKCPQLPWLVGHRKDDRGRHTIYSFFSLSADPRFGPRLDPLPLPDAPLGLQCCGCAHGWMALLERTPSITLFNPVTRSRIRLPPITDFPETSGIEYSKDGDRYVQRCGRDVHVLNFESMQGYLANKVILSSDPILTSDCVVMLIHCHWERFAFCRPGDDAWTPIESPLLGGYNVDAVFYSGKFYIAVDRTICVCSVGTNVKMAIAQQADPPYNKHPVLSEVDECYLVEASGHLLLVTIYYRTLYYMNGFYEVEIFRLEWIGHRLKLVKLKNLGDRAIFLGRNQSFSLSMSQFPEVKRNCIYLAEFFQDDRTMVRVIDVANNSNQLISNDSVDAYPDWQPCTWIKPSLL